MERSQVLDAMGQLKLYGMRTAYDEVIATAVKRQHEPQRIIGDLLTAEISEKEARSAPPWTAAPFKNGSSCSASTWFAWDGSIGQVGIRTPVTSDSVNGLLAAASAPIHSVAYARQGRKDLLQAAARSSSGCSRLLL